MVIAVAVAVAGCGGRSFSPNNARDVFVKDFQSTEPTACTTDDVDLTNAEVLSFFSRARPLTYKQLTENYPEAPCRLVGTLNYSGHTCDWKVSAAATGSIQCGDRNWYFACDDCQALLTGS